MFIQMKFTCFSSDPSNIYGFKEFSISFLLLVQKISGMIRMINLVGGEDDQLLGHLEKYKIAKLQRD